MSTVAALCGTVKLRGAGWAGAQGEDGWVALGHKREIHISVLRHALPDERRRGVLVFCFSRALLSLLEHDGFYKMVRTFYYGCRCRQVVA